MLLEKLGQGGMGVVFKAKDLLKVEAQDKDPYVAIKVLTDAFKKYSGSFIALQREASKAQRLAHPNIATVYDFDRDGNTVFMTMEYLQGKPLNQLIKELNKKPLKQDHALHIIEELVQRSRLRARKDADPFRLQARQLFSAQRRPASSCSISVSRAPAPRPTKSAKTPCSTRPS